MHQVTSQIIQAAKTKGYKIRVPKNVEDLDDEQPKKG